MIGIEHLARPGGHDGRVSPIASNTAVSLEGRRVRADDSTCRDSQRR